MCTRRGLHVTGNHPSGTTSTTYYNEILIKYRVYTHHARSCFDQVQHATLVRTPKLVQPIDRYYYHTSSVRSFEELSKLLRRPGTVLQFYCNVHQSVGGGEKSMSVGTPPTRRGRSLLYRERDGEHLPVVTVSQPSSVASRQSSPSPPRGPHHDPNRRYDNREPGGGVGTATRQRG